MSELLRLYEPEECGNDGYPYEWHRTIKKLVRDQCDNRCVRCGHPYKGTGEWSTCDEHCTHAGEIRYRGTELDGAFLGPPHEYEWEIVTLEDISARELRAPNSDVGDDTPRYVVQARWRVLTTHHLNRIKADCRWWNLVPLCQRCHLQIQAKVKLDRPWPFAHTAWFQAYAAGFYASKYLREEISHEEALARLNELLEVGMEHERENWVAP